MRYVRWIFLFAATAAVWACTPFVGQRVPDGGGGGSAGSGGESMGAGGPGAQGGAISSGSAGRSNPVQSGPDAGTDTAEDAPASAIGSSNGAACKFDTDCQFGHCADGVCCEASCSAKCMSCLSAYTGKPDGKCAPVQAGFVHGADCPTSAPSTCGLDGKCDGSGACRQYLAGTVCAQEVCTDGTSTTSTALSGRACDGSGTCVAPVTSDCGTYRCSGTRCGISCAGDLDCVANALCTQTQCIAKKTDGSVCSANVECKTGVCGGRCCAAGCTCTQPSSTNLLKNPGFDTDTSAWSVSIGTISRSSSDTEGCVYSGSLEVVVPQGDLGRTLYQCVRNTLLEGDLNFGVRAVSSVPGHPICQVNFYSGTNCDGNLTTQNETDPPLDTVDWQDLSGTITSVPVSNSVDFVCYFAADPSGTATYLLDMAYVANVPGRY